MKRTIWVLIILMLLIPTACALGTFISTPSDTTPTPIWEFSQQVETVVSAILTQTAAPATLTPIPSPASHSTKPAFDTIFESPVLGIHFNYPQDWYLQDLTTSQPPTVILSSFDPAKPPHKLEWNAETISVQFQLLPDGSVPKNIDEWLKSARQSASAVHLSIFEEARTFIAGQPAARLTLVSGSGGITHQVLTVLDGSAYEIMIEGNLDLGMYILDTIQIIPPSGLKPPDSDTPAAGICAEGQGDPVNIILGNGPDGLPIAGRCIMVNSAQRFNLINQSNLPYEATFAGYKIRLQVGDSLLLDKPVGEYLAAGVHYLPMAPALWIKGKKPQEK